MNNRTKRKKAVTYLVLMLALSILAGCATGSNNNKSEQTATPGETANTEPTTQYFNAEGFPIVNTPIQLKVMGMKAPNHGPWIEMPFFEKMESLTNMKLTLQEIPSESFNERKSLAFASNDLPDIFLKAGITQSEQIKYGDHEGMLLPLQDLIEQYAPNLSGLMKEFPEIRRAITTPSGNIYALPQFNNRPDTAMIWVNKKWIDQLGLSMPETIDDYYKLLKAFKEQDPNGNGQPDEIPLNLVGLNHFNYLLGSFGILRDARNVFAQDDGTAVFVPATEGFKQALLFYNRLYQEQLLDNESFTINTQQQKAKASGENQVLGSFMSSGAFLVVGTEQNADYVALPALKGADGSQMWMRFQTTTGGQFALTKNNSYPEASIRWVDYFYSDEGGKLAYQGVEGIDWSTNADGSWTQIIPEGMGKGDARGKATPGSGAGGFAMKDPVKWLYTEYEEVPLNANIRSEKEKLIPYLRIPFPNVYLDTEQQKRIDVLNADLEKYVNQMMTKFIIGETSIDQKWEEYLKMLEQMGMKEYQTIYQDAYNNYLKN